MHFSHCKRANCSLVRLLKSWRKQLKVNSSEENKIQTCHIVFLKKLTYFGGSNYCLFVLVATLAAAVCAPLLTHLSEFSSYSDIKSLTCSLHNMFHMLRSLLPPIINDAYEYNWKHNNNVKVYNIICISICCFWK